MPNSNIINIISVIPVKDHAASVVWYAKLLARAPDIVPVEEVAEWQLADNAWIQVGSDAERAGGTTVIIGVENINIQCDFCASVDIPFGEIIEYPGLIRMSEVIDPDGNKVVFVQDISGEREQRDC